MLDQVINNAWEKKKGEEEEMEERGGGESVFLVIFFYTYKWTEYEAGSRNNFSDDKICAGREGRVH